MGSINKIYNPIYWKITFEGRSKIIKDDIIYRMIIGYGEDYQPYDIIEFISKDNYENIINGNYLVKTFSYEELPILLFDEQYRLIPLIKGTEIPYDKLSRIQKEYIKSTIPKKLVLKK